MITKIIIFTHEHDCAAALAGPGEIPRDGGL